MRIALVNPVARRCQGYHTIGSKIPQLGLQVLAQLTPQPHTPEIIDEIFGFEMSDREIRRGRYDLVGVTSYSSGATRAYELAEQCRREGIPCIMGGPHASTRPDEAAAHFDSVAIGECDEVWPQIVADAAAGRLQPRYQCALAELSRKGAGRARQQLQPLNGSYDVASIQTSRGCPVGCDYCSVTNFNGATIRRRDVGDIVDEWNSTLKRFIFVTDDNF
ncbi:MAG: radical SAM protein, partial [Hyphomicrobiaceae bacterium]